MGARVPIALSLDGLHLAGGHPSTFAIRAFALPDCATSLTAGDGEVYLLVNPVAAGTNTREYHVEVFDPTTGGAEITAPVVLQNIGSAVADTDMTFGNGSLWLYGGTPGSADRGPASRRITGQVVSPIVNAVLRSAASIPPSPPTGPGRGSGADRAARRSSTGRPPDADHRERTSSFTQPTSDSRSCGWRPSAAGSGPAWRPVRTKSRATKVTTRLVALDDSGNVAVRSPSEPVGLFPAEAPRRTAGLWDVQYAAELRRPRTPARHRPRRQARRVRSRMLASPPGACDQEDGGSELAVDGAGRLRAAPDGRAWCGRPLPGRHLTADRAPPARRAARPRPLATTRPSTCRALMKPCATAWPMKLSRSSKKPSTLRMPHRLLWRPELGPGHGLHELLVGAKAARQHDEGVGQ